MDCDRFHATARVQSRKHRPHHVHAGDVMAAAVEIEESVFADANEEIRETLSSRQRFQIGALRLRRGPGALTLTLSRRERG
jgi:hypothetical protein